ncbi:MAG: anthranilate synthase component I [Candidatus Euphemobacter frigidus]|nr:anthranilate synthase component I [Candidatus Euphemobacter frigidus]MDP8276681.1 anthranilate synthase component I [Candidatus Euphemobacter frigidus]
MYYPNLKLFQEKARQGNLIPVYTELVADRETPVSAFMKLGDSPYAYLLESVESGGGIGRYSFLGSNPSLIFKSRGSEAEINEHNQTRKLRSKNPLMLLKGLLKNYRPVKDETLPPFSGGAVGYISYDCVRFFEEIPEEKLDELNLPELYFMLTDTIIIFDRLMNKLKIVANAHISGDPERAYGEAVSRIETLLGQLMGGAGGTYFQPPPIRPRGELISNMTPKVYEKAVRAAQEYIRAGDILQVVLSQRFRTETNCPPLDIYRALRTINPSPYMFFLQFDNLHLIGSSPEIMVQVVGDEVRVRPIAGTRPRGSSVREDARLEEELLADPKERAEHIMLVDLGRNDVGRVSLPGSVRVDEMMGVEKYSHVMHIVSDVRGKLRPSEDAYSAFSATFPAGTVSGAPKIRAMEIIEELEPVRRGPYAGAVGYFSFDGNLDSCITIRTIIVKDRTAFIQAGAGIVADSVPEREHQECLQKAQALFRAVQMAEGGLQ